MGADERRKEEEGCGSLAHKDAAPSSFGESLPTQRYLEYSGLGFNMETAPPLSLEGPTCLVSWAPGSTH